MSTALTTLTNKLAKRLDLGDGSSLVETLKLTAFRQRGNDVVTDAQMEALLIVAEQYRLNPFTKELFAFADKGAIVPVVSVDGWSRIINENPAFNGLEFRYSDQIVTMTRGKPCPEWCEVVIYRRDRERPIVVREYLDEVYQSPRGRDGGFDGPWQTHTKRFLRHKTLIQGARIAFGFAGIYDEDEAHRIIDAGAIDATTGEVIQQKAATRAELPAYPATDFDANLTAWGNAIKAGKATPDALISKVSTKGTLTDDQKQRIRDLAKKPAADFTDVQPKGEAPAPQPATAGADDSDLPWED
jgi:phage recombination protein Bet